MEGFHTTLSPPSYFLPFEREGVTYHPAAALPRAALTGAISTVFAAAFRLSRTTYLPARFVAKREARIETAAAALP